MASMVTVAVHHDLSDAMVARSCLEAYGLVAVLPEWNHATIAWHFVYALDGLRLWQLLGNVTDLERATATPKQTSNWLSSDITIVGLATAAAAFVMAGLPMPIWKRRLRRA
jgi:hypothetical protein